MDERYRRLFSVLQKNTDAGQAQWEDTGVRDQFSLNLENGAILLDRYEVEDTADKYGLTVLNSQGKKLESWIFHDWTTEGAELGRLFKQVFRQVNRVDQVIDSVLGELEKKIE